MKNHIPTAFLGDLFPEIGDNLQLNLSGAAFGFRPGELPLLLPYEMMTLAALVRLHAPRRLLEFGTAQGITTTLLAANAPDNATVVTVDISGDSEYKSKCLRGDVEVGRIWRESPFAGKVRQVFRTVADAVPPDVDGRIEPFDLVHVDADHTYEGVKADTELALRLASESAVITWHDFYTFPRYVEEPRTRGVFPFLNELMQAGTIQLRHIAGTYLVVGCKAWRSDLPGEILQPGEATSPFDHRHVRLADAGWRGPR